MASNQTEHYELNQWLSTDQVVRTDFNADNAKIDAALAGKAAQTALTSLSDDVQELADTVEGLETACGGFGNCQIYTTSYTGTGTYGSSNAISLTFPHKPMLVTIIAQGTGTMMQAVQGANTTFSRATGAGFVTVSWSENTMTWYGTEASLHMNQSGHLYLVVALLAADE